MKTNHHFPSPNPCRSAFLRIGFIAALCVGVSATAFAKKGGGKPGSEDPPPPDPEPNPAPMSYVLTWLPGDGDGSTVYDVDADGVAIGSYSPAGVFADRFGVVSFPDRANLINLEGLASAHPDYPAGWRLTTAFTISDGLLIGGDLYDLAGEQHCFALQLVDNGPALTPGVSWFRVFSAGDVGGMSLEGAVLYDASELGDLTILTMAEQPDGSRLTQGFVWRPADGVPSAATLAGPTTFGAINNQRDILWGGGLGPVVVNADSGSTTELGQYNGDLTTADDISDSGMVVGGSQSRKKGRYVNQAVRFVNGQWEEIPGSATSSKAVKVNSADQILGFSGPQLFLFSDDPDVGFRLIDDLLDASSNSAADLDLWNTAGALEGSNGWLFSISDPDGSGFGHICGRRMINGVERGFILTPTSP